MRIFLGSHIYSVTYTMCVCDNMCAWNCTHCVTLLTLTLTLTLDMTLTVTCHMKSVTCCQCVCVPVCHAEIRNSSSCIWGIWKYGLVYWMHSMVCSMQGYSTLVSILLGQNLPLTITVTGYLISATRRRATRGFGFLGRSFFAERMTAAMSQHWGLEHTVKIRQVLYF